MRYIKSINDFLFEVLNLEQDNKFRELAKDRDDSVLNYLHSWFEGYSSKYNYETQTGEDGKIDRIYISVNNVVVPTKLDLVNSDVFVYIRRNVSALGYDIVDYLGGYCVKVGEQNKRMYRIGAIIQKEIKRFQKEGNVAFVNFWEDILQKFITDKHRSLIEGEYKIVVSYRYSDVASMSTKRGWNSCMNLDGGVYCRFLDGDVLGGTIVAYLIKANDVNINSPLGRLSIKRFYNYRVGEYCWLPDLKPYGIFPNSLMSETINKFLNHQPFVYEWGNSLFGRYEKDSDLYSDFKSPEVYIYEPNLSDNRWDFFGVDYTYVNGYDEDGYDENGYNEDGYDRDGYNEDGYDEYGYDSEGYNEDGYGRDGYDKYGYDEDGYNENGYNEDGYDSEGYNEDGYNEDGYDKYGYDEDGYDRDGYDRDGYDRDGYDKYGYDEDGYDSEGYNEDGYDRDGYDKYGYDEDGYNEYGYDEDGYNRDGEKE